MDKAVLNTDTPLQGLLDKKDKSDNVSECQTCGICNSRCTWFDGDGGPVPRQMIRMAQLGMEEEVLEIPIT